MYKVSACLAMLLVFPFLSPDETPDNKKTDTLPTIASVAADLGLGECVLIENNDGKPKPGICVGSCEFQFRTYEGEFKPSFEVEFMPDWQDVAGEVVEQRVSAHVVYYDRDVKIWSTKLMSDLKFKKGLPTSASMKTELPRWEISGNRLAVLIVEEPTADQGSRPIKVLSFQSMVVTTEK